VVTKREREREAFKEFNLLADKLAKDKDIKDIMKAIKKYAKKK